MARMLSGPGPRLLQLNRRDPLRAFGDYSYLDAAITRMFAQLPAPAPSPPLAQGVGHAGIGGVIFPLEPGDQIGDRFYL